MYVSSGPFNILINTVFQLTGNHHANRCTSDKKSAVETYLRFLGYRYKEHVILHRVDDDWNVSEGGGDDPAAVVPGVLGPDDVDFVIPQVTELQRQIGSLLIRVITALYEGSWLTNWIIILGGKNNSPLKKATTLMPSMRIFKKAQVHRGKKKTTQLAFHETHWNQERHVSIAGTCGWMGTGPFPGFVKNLILFLQQSLMLYVAECVSTQWTVWVFYSILQ